MTFKAILFDLDNTLVPEMAAYAAALADAMTRIPEVGNLNVDALRRAAFEALRSSGLLRHWATTACD